jgi:hypothetical protein
VLSAKLSLPTKLLATCRETMSHLCLRLLGMTILSPPRRDVHDEKHKHSTMMATEDDLKPARLIPHLKNMVLRLDRELQVRSEWDTLQTTLFPLRIRQCITAELNTECHRG